MGYRSEVTVMCGEKAYEMIKQSIEQYNATSKSSYNFVPHNVEFRNDGNEVYTYLLKWHDVKWYHDYSDVSSVESVLNELCSDKYSNKDGYGFKKIEIGEDNATIECSNEAGEEYGYEFYVQCSMSQPDGFREFDF